jgi:hypothetical protein
MTALISAIVVAGLLGAVAGFQLYLRELAGIYSREWDLAFVTAGFAALIWLGIGALVAIGLAAVAAYAITGTFAATIAALLLAFTGYVASYLIWFTREAHLHRSAALEFGEATIRLPGPADLLRGPAMDMEWQRPALVLNVPVRAWRAGAYFCAGRLKAANHIATAATGVLLPPSLDGIYAYLPAREPATLTFGLRLTEAPGAPTAFPCGLYTFELAYREGADRWVRTAWLKVEIAADLAAALGASS